MMAKMHTSPDLSSRGQNSRDLAKVRTITESYDWTMSLLISHPTLSNVAIPRIFFFLPHLHSPYCFIEVIAIIPNDISTTIVVMKFSRACHWKSARLVILHSTSLTNSEQEKVELQSDANGRGDPSRIQLVKFSVFFRDLLPFHCNHHCSTKIACICV